MTVDSNGARTSRPPAVVATAAILLGIYGVLTLVVAVYYAGRGTVLLGIIGVVYVLSAYGLWRANWIARIVVLIFAGLEAVALVLALERLTTPDLLRAGLLVTIGGLVLIPEAAKDWFRKR